MKALTVGFPLLMFFLLVFCLLGILPVLYIYVCYILLPPCCCLCCTLCCVKHWSREALLEDCLELLSFCEHQGETQHVFFSSWSRVGPAAGCSWCCEALLFICPSSVSGIHLWMWMKFLRCRVNGAKETLRCGLQHAARVIPIPKPHTFGVCLVYSPRTKWQRREAWEACWHHCLSFSETRLPVCGLCAGCVHFW